MSDQKQFRLNVLSLWVGILIPILAAIIPFGAKYIFPEHRLDYSLVGPISVKGKNVISVKINNSGEDLERNIRLYLKKTPFPLDSETDIDALATVDTQAPAKISKEGDWIVIDLGDLRPSESLNVNVMSEFIAPTVFDGEDPMGISVKSDANLAQFDGRSEFTGYIYQFGFWMFIILMMLILIIGIYQQYFMDPKKREELILKEIDKLSKGPRV